MNLATGTLATRVPLIDLPTFPGLKFGFALIHNSGVTVSPTKRSAAKNWIHTGHEYLWTEDFFPNPPRFPNDTGYSSWRHGDDGAWAGSWGTTDKVQGKENPIDGTRDSYDRKKDKVRFYGSKAYTLFEHKAEFTPYDKNLYHYSRVNLVTEQNNGLGPDGKGDRIAYAYDKDDRLSTITEVARDGTKLRSIKLNYVRKKDAIESVVLNYTENGVPKQRGWAITDFNGPLDYVDGPGGAASVPQRAAFAYVKSDCKRVAWEADEKGGWRYEYDSQGRVKEIRPPDPTTGFAVPVGTGIRIEYSGDKTKVTDPLNRTTTYTHSASGRKKLSRIDYPPYRSVLFDGSFSTAPPTTSFETFTWSGDDVKEHLDRRGFKTTYTYDKFDGRSALRYVDAPDGGRTEYKFNGDTEVYDWIQDPKGTRCSFQYNGLKQMIAKTIVAADPSPGVNYAGPDLTQTWTYDANGRLIQETSGNDLATVYSQHDPYGRPRAVRSPWNSTTTTEFDGLGNKATETPPAPRTATTYQYDDSGALWKVLAPAGTTRQTVRAFYGASEPIVSAQKDARGYITKTFVDWLGRPRFVRRYSQPVGGDAMDPVESAAQSAEDIETGIVYDAVGNPVREVDGNGKATVHAYDELNRRVRTVYPDGTVRVWQYDAGGNVERAYDGLGRLTVCTYDWANRPLLTAYPAGSNTPNVERHYRTDGLMDWMTDGIGRTDFAYSKAKQLIRCVQPIAGATVGYTYDGAGRRATVVVGSQTWTYAYVLSRLDHIDATVGQARPATYGYNGDGSVDTVTYGNGYKTQYGYDGAGRVQDIWHRNPQGADLRHLTYGYNGGNVASIDDASPSGTANTQNGYDFADRITSEVRTGGLTGYRSFAYAYDKAGNRLQTVRNGGTSSYATAPNDRFLSGDGWTMPLGNYDANGNPGRILGPDGIDWTMTYDAENRLTKVQAATGAADTFRYDGAGDRVELVRPSGTSRYVLDGAAILAIADGTNRIVEYRLAGVGSAFPAATAGGAATNAYDMPDLMGSTLATRDGAGALVRADNYDAYGNPERVVDGPWRAGRFAGAHGYVSDQDTGFDLCGARYYLPALGRFLTQDPIGHEGGLNLYAYCDDNPLLKVDPDGRNPLLGALMTFGNVLPFFKTYPSEEAAATAAGAWGMARGYPEQREWGGFISANYFGTVFRLSMPQYADKGNEANLQLRNEPGNTKAYWHVHPFLRGTPYPGVPSWKVGNPFEFSVDQTNPTTGVRGGDIYTANKLRVNGYMTSFFGVTRKYDYKTGRQSILPSGIWYLFP